MRGEAALRGGRADRSRRARAFQSGDPQALLRRADPRRAPLARRTARPLPDDEGVRRRPGDEGAPPDGDRALRHLERGQARGRARPAPVRDPRGAARRPAAPREPSSGGCRPRATSTSAAAGCPRSRSTGTRSARSARRCARRATTSRSARSGSSARSSRASGWRSELGRLPKFADWAAARRADPGMLTEWQVYRMFDARRGAWATFQFLVRGRLLEQGLEVRSDGSVAGA